MIETKPFSIFTFVERLRSFYYSFRETDFLVIRFVRDPGSNEFKLIYGMGHSGSDAKEEIYESVDPQEFEMNHDAPFEKALLESVLDAFSIPNFEENPEVGDPQAQDLFEHNLNCGFTLLAESPYIEIQLTFSAISGGIACAFTLSRTNFKENIQYNNILIQVVYPLASSESEEDKDEEIDPPQVNQD